MAAMTIRRVGVLSVGKIYGALSGGMGLLLGAIFALVSAVGGSGWLGPDAPGFMGVMFGVGAIIFLPLFYGAMGFVIGLIGAALYNLLAGVVGGVKIEAE